MYPPSSSPLFLLVLRAIGASAGTVGLVTEGLATLLSQLLRDIHEIELPKERGMVLRRECFCETVSRHLSRRQSFDRDCPIFHFLAQPMLMNINMAELRLAHRNDRPGRCGE